MISARVRPRSSIADPELARSAVVDLPPAPAPARQIPKFVLDAVASARRASEREQERVIVLTLVPVAARRR